MIPELIARAAADPHGEWPVLVDAARRAIRSQHFGAVSLAYTVLGLALENGLARRDELDIIDFILADGDAASLPVLLRIQQFAKSIGDVELLRRAQRAAEALRAMATEEPPLFPAKGEWERLRSLADSGTNVELTDTETVEYVLKIARQVAMGDSDIERGKRDEVALNALVGEVRARIRDGSRRLMAAIAKAQASIEAGDRDQARQHLTEIISTERVPWYREQARRELACLDDPNSA